MINFIKNNYECMPVISSIAARTQLMIKVGIFITKFLGGNSHSFGPSINPYFEKIDNKPLYRLFLMELPVFGNIAIYMIDRLKKQHFANHNASRLALVNLAETGDIRGLKTLKANRAFDKYELELAIVLAAKQGRSEATKNLLQFASDHLPSEQILRLRSDAVKEASIKCHLNVIEVLLSNNELIDETARKTVILFAARNGSHTIVKALLSSVSDDEDRDLRTLAICEAADKGHVACIVELSKDRKPLNQDHLKFPLNQAASRNDFSVVQSMLGSFHDVITHESRILATFHAAENGHLLMIQELLSGVRLSEEYRKMIAFKGAEYGQVSVVEAYFRIGDVLPALKVPIPESHSRNNQVIANKLIRSNHGKMDLLIEGVSKRIVDLVELTDAQKTAIEAKWTSSSDLQ